MTAITCYEKNQHVHKLHCTIRMQVNSTRPVILTTLPECLAGQNADSKYNGKGNCL